MASGWNLWVWLVCGVVRRYIDFLIISLIPTPLVLALFCSSIPTSLFIFKMFFFILVLIIVLQIRLWLATLSWF